MASLYIITIYLGLFFALSGWGMSYWTNGDGTEWEIGNGCVVVC